MTVKNTKKLTFGQTVLFISLSILFVSVPFWGAWLIYCKFFDIRATDPKYNIVAIIQEGSKNEMLKTSFLAEILELSIDNPKNIYQINLKEEQDKLHAFPVIQKATLKRIPPSTLFVEYSMRQPICFIVDLTNTVIDEKGFIFPFKPFYSPKKMPEIYLGLNQRLSWGEQIIDERLHLALRVLHHFKQTLKTPFEVVRIDVADAFAENLGKKQIVAVLSKEGKEFILRLSGNDVNRTIIAFENLFLKNLNGKSFSKVTIDLRLPHLAFVSL